MAVTTTLVVGASRGLGRGIAEAFARTGAPTVAVARSGPALAELAAITPDLRTETADATDPEAAERLLRTHRPDVVVLVAGATPTMAPLPDQTWETFSVNWHTDVKVAFHWLRAALLLPLRPGSRVIVVSSGAALAGSPLSGGYAGAKATQRIITTYARDEAARAGLDIGFAAVLPRITPLTGLGRTAMQAYAARNGQQFDEYVRSAGDPLTPEIAGAAIVALATGDAGALARDHLLTGAGLQPLP